MVKKTWNNIESPIKERGIIIFTPKKPRLILSDFYLNLYQP